MKKILGLVAGLLMVASVSFAAAPAKSFELGFNGGIGIATNTGYDLGFGGQVTGLYRADENLGLGLGVGFDTFNVTGSTSTVGASLADLSFLATLKYSFGSSSTKPYIIVGAGLSDTIATLTISSVSISGSQMNPEIQGGVGVEFPVGTDVNLFLQGTANVIFDSGDTFTYIPVDLGVNFDM